MFSSYILCGTPRTGSTLLCEMLAASGVAGVPDSYLASKFVPWWAGEWGLPSQEAAGEAFWPAYLEKALKVGRGGTGVFGLRLMREDLEAALAVLDGLWPGLPDDRARFEQAFGPVLFLHLSREDKLAQAVSLVKAQQTGLWHIAPDGREVERLAPPAPPVYDFARLAAEVARLEAFDAAWEPWFAAQGIEPLRLRYETVAQDPATAVEAVLRGLGVTVPDLSALKPAVAVLADEVSAEWIRRYREEAG